MPGPFICEKCGKRMFSFVEFIDYSGHIYCKQCDPNKPSALSVVDTRCRPEAQVKTVKKQVFKREIMIRFLEFSIALTLLAVLPVWPYSYYLVLRLVVCVS